LGIGLGSALAAVALHADTRTAYVTLIVADAATFLAAAVLVMRLPHVAPLTQAQADATKWVAVRDRPYVALVAANALVCVHNGLLEIALPLWVVRDTSAPRWLVAVLFLVNTSMCVLFQVRASRGVDDVAGSVRALRRSGLLLLAACVL